ncbi:hypothetical protein ILUMI_10789 [Ignelater luminosus]|uniref:Single domain-containing protein n=1 Tax=Ignelater luminosus TaxID=2038154 RepID=A0A8K0CX87_IGNLU|nr:hypothetical protein ILUMI_10789 [Ignelater luminosus]
MKEYMIPFFVIVLTKSLLVKSWHAIEYHVEHPFHPGKCYSQQFKMYIDIGATIRKIKGTRRSYCQKMHCIRGYDDELQISHAGCPFVVPQNNCEVVKGLKDLPYPSCCSRLDCSGRKFIKQHDTTLKEICSKTGFFCIKRQ